MNPHAEQVEAIFTAALAKAGADERASFLSAACGSDDVLRSRVEVLLRAHQESSGQYFDAPLFVPPLSQAGEVIAETPGAEIGRYQIVERIGEGGFGSVYLAAQQEPVRRQVALKIIKLGMDTKQVVRRFETERQALAMMDHSGIATVYDAGATDNGRPYFVMEFVPGDPITQYCDEHKLTVTERLRLFIDVCHAVQHAHQKGIIHRDLKPTNVLVTQQDSKPVPKIIDFGVAKATDQRMAEWTHSTEHPQMVGTPEYMSPEQATFGKSDVDTRSDVYALGVMLYELLVGTTPFEAETLHCEGYDRMLHRIREQDPATPSRRLSASTADVATICAKRKSQPSALRKLLRNDLEWIVMKCLEKERERRYETASALADDIGRYLNHELISARAPTAVYSMRKFVRKHRGPVIASAGYDRKLNVWNADKHELIATLDAPADVTSLLFSGQHLIAGCIDGNLCRWSLSAPQPHSTLRKVKIGDGAVRMAMSSDMRELAVGYASGIVPLFDTANWRPIGSDEQYDGRRLLFQPIANRQNGWTMIGHENEPGSLTVWDLESDEVLATLDSRQVQVLAVDSSPDGKQLATGGIGDDVEVWSMDHPDSPPRLMQRASGTKNMVWSLTFSSDGSSLFGAGWDKTVKIWDVDTGLLRAVLRGHVGMVTSIALSSDGARLVSGSMDGTVRMWNLDEHLVAAPVATPAYGAENNSLAFSHDGSKLAFASGYDALEAGN